MNIALRYYLLRECYCVRFSKAANGETFLISCMRREMSVCTVHHATMVRK